VAVAAVWPASAGAAAPALDIPATREAAAPKVCLVTVQDQLGLPIAYATGFLLGEGKFVVTDLASVAQPGAKDVSLRFCDGKTAAAQKFGMADPAIGLAVLQVDPPLEGASGLVLSASPPTAGPVEVTIVGWRYAQELSVTPGHVANGLPAADLAARLKVTLPNTDMTFLGYEGNRPDMAGGAPVLDKTGEVVAVAVLLAGLDKPLVVPAELLRRSLMASDRQLRPLSDLPKPVWPVDIQPLAMKPPGQADFAQVVRGIRLRCRCGQCNGKGQIVVQKIAGTQTLGGVTKKIIKLENQTCPKCRGEGAILPDGFYDQFSRMAQIGTWLALNPGTEPRVRDAACSVGMELIKTLALIGKQFRGDLLKESQADLAAADLAFPRGVVVYAQVRESVDGPDGKYHLLHLAHGHAALAVRTDRWADASEGTRKAPGIGHWIVLAGAANGRAALGQQKPLHVFPFRWAHGPNLGGAALPPDVKPDSTPTPGPPTPRKPGDPNFFGL
jgi:hypothetical protein